jgi:hypothetical protein
MMIGGDIMKKALTLIVILFALWCNAEKVALIPAVPELIPLADRVLAEMSNRPGMEFLERTEVEKILKERQLSAISLTEEKLFSKGGILHADLFAIITPGGNKKAVSAVGLIVYDSRSGFQLINTALAEKNTVTAIIKHLAEALKIIKSPEKQIFISMTAVRNAGVSERFKYKLNYFSTDLARHLSRIPGVIMLERGYLNSVNRERKLTGKTFKLASSAKLIRLEFSPGTSPEVINFNLRVTDTANKELFNFNLSDCMRNPENAINKSVEALARYLKTSLPQNIVSARDEAARFFAEYQFLFRLRDYKSARHKLNSAIALNPKLLKYRLAEMKLNKGLMDSTPVQTIISMIEKNLGLAPEIKRDFPNVKELYTTCYFDWDSLTNKTSSIQDYELKKIAELAAIYRTKNLKWEREKFLKFDLKDGINTHKEWKNYIGYCAISGHYERFWDAAKWCQTNYNNSLEILKISYELYRDNPTLAKKCKTAEMFYLVLSKYRSGRGYPEKAKFKAAVEGLFRNCDEYISLAKNHPDKYARLRALQCELLRRTIINNYDDTTFRNEFRQFCFQQSKIMGKRSNSHRPDFFLNWYFGYNSRHAKIMTQVRQEDIVIFQVKPKINNCYTIKEMNNIIRKETTREGKARKYLELMPHIRRYAVESFSDITVSDFFRWMQYIKTRDSLPEYDSILSKLQKAINRDIEIKQLCSIESIIGPVVKQRNPPKIAISNVVYRKDKLFFLLCKEKFIRQNKPFRYFYQYSWRVGEMEILTGKLKSLSPWSKWQEQRRVGSFNARATFSVADDTAISGYGNRILIFQLNSGKIQEIKDLPGKEIMSVTLLDGRIYAFAGEVRNRQARETILFSCKIDGSDRKIHISTSRDVKKNPLDRKNPFVVYSVFSDNIRKRLIFSSVSQNKPDAVRGLWEFIPDTGASKELYDKKYSSISKTTARVNNKLFFWLYHDFCIYDITTDRVEIFFSTQTPTAKNYLKIKLHFGGGIAYSGPFYARPNQIWLCANRSFRLMTLPKREKSPLISLPYVKFVRNSRSFVYPFPDGKSVIIIRHNQIYKITPKNP